MTARTILNIIVASLICYSLGATIACAYLPQENMLNNAAAIAQTISPEFDPRVDEPLPKNDQIDQDKMVCVMYVFFGKLTSFYTLSEDYPNGGLIFFGPDAFIAAREHFAYHNLPRLEFVREDIINLQQFIKLLKTAPNCPEELKALIEEFTRPE